MKRRRQQAGSITPVWLVLVMTTLSLLLLFVDREWVNYQVRKVEQTADFAAEAGLAAAAVTYHLRVDGQLGTPELKQDCETCEPYTDWLWQPWATICSGRLEELTGAGWRERCGCTASSDQLIIECLQVRELTPEITWTSRVEEQINQTFAANWVDRPNSRVTYTYITAGGDPPRRLARLFVNIRVSSLFSIGWWPDRNIPIWGQATLKIPPLELRTN